MKKILLYGSILISTSALALGIDINTKIKWNSVVVVAAAHDVGLEAKGDTYYEVSSTYYRILGDLLERDTFSVADAVSVCNQECNKSQFLKEGRGQSGKKCPEICKSFGNALIEENNKKTYALQLDDEGYVYDSRGRIYTYDKEFYAYETETMYSGKENGSRDDAPCYTAIFETKTDKKIAICAGTWSEDGAIEESFTITDAKYKDYEFILGCNGNWVWNESASCSLHVDSPQIREKQQKKQEYEELYKSASKCVDSLKKVDFTGINNIRNDALYGLVTEKAKDALNKLYDGRNFKEKFAVFKPESYDLYNELKSDYDKYCLEIRYYNRAWSGYKQVEIEEYLGEPFVYTVKEIYKKLKSYFQSNNRTFKDVQTKTLAEARKRIIDYIPSTDLRLGVVIDISELKCAGDCNKFGQDYVTCTLGPLTGTFEFDDICQSKVEGFLNNMF